MAQYDHLNGQGNTPYGGASYSPSPYASQDRLGPTSSPYASGDPYYNESTGYITPQPAKKGTSNWIKIGIPVAILVIAAAVVGGILGTRHKSAQAATSGVAAASAAKKVGLFATATNSEFMMPIYPSAVSQLSCVFGLTFLMRVARQMLQPTLPRLSTLLAALCKDGPQTHSNHLTLAPRAFALIVLGLSHPPTNGKLFQHSSLRTLIFSLGMQQSLAMLQIITANPPLCTSWMETVVFWIIRVQSKSGSRPSHMPTV